MIVVAQLCGQGVHWPSAVVGAGIAIPLTALIMEIWRRLHT